MLQPAIADDSTEMDVLETPRETSLILDVL